MLVIVAVLAPVGWTALRTGRNVVAAVRRGDANDIRRLRSGSWKDLPAAFEAAFTPRVDGRDLAVRRFAQFRLTRLGVSPTPRVWVGNDGWLFLNHDTDPDYLPPGDPRLDARLDRWAECLTEWRGWLAERGTRLLVVVAPDKRSVYPEHLPAAQRKSSRPSPLDGLLARCRAVGGPDVLDLRTALREAKRRGPVYFRLDTHWNPAGSVAGYRATARAMGFEPHGDDAIVEDGTGERRGDLVGLLGYWPGGPERFTSYRLKRPTARRVPVDSVTGSRLDHLSSSAFEKANGPRVLFVHDSFGDGFFAEMLAEHCGRLLAAPSNHLDAALIGREQPDVVVLEIVERSIQGVTPRRKD